MKQFNILTLALLLFSFSISCSQSTSEKAINKIEKLVGKNYPTEFKEFLNELSAKDKTINFYLLNEKYELIKYNDISVLEKANNNLPLEESIGYIDSELLGYFGNDIETKALPFATSVNHFSDDKIDFLAILVSNSPKLDGKIIYINSANTKILPSIVGNSPTNIFGEYKECIDILNAAVPDTVTLPVKGAINFLHDIVLEKVDVSEGLLTEINLEKQFSGPQLINSKIDISKSENNYRTTTLTLEHIHSKKLYSNSFLFIDKTETIKDEFSYSNRLNWIDYPRLYSFYVKALSSFRFNLNEKGIDIERILTKYQIDDIVKQGLYCYYKQDASPLHLEENSGYKYPSELLSDLNRPQDLNALIDINGEEFQISRYKDGKTLEDYSQDLEFFEVIGNLSKKDFNGISDSVDVLPFAMFEIEDGRVKYLSIIKTTYDKFNNVDGNILMSNYNSTMWNPHAINSKIIYKSFKALEQNHPISYKPKFKNLRTDTFPNGAKYEQGEIISNNKARSFLTFTSISIAKEKDVLKIFYEGQTDLEFFETFFIIKAIDGKLNDDEILSLIVQSSKELSRQNEYFNETFLGLNSEKLANYALNEFYRQELTKP